MRLLLIAALQVVSLSAYAQTYVCDPSFQKHFVHTQATTWTEKTRYRFTDGYAFKREGTGWVSYALPLDKSQRPDMCGETNEYLKCGLGEKLVLNRKTMRYTYANFVPYLANHEGIDVEAGECREIP